MHSEYIMAAEMEMRARCPRGTVVRWVALLLLLQCLGSHPSLAAPVEDGHVTVKIKKYFNYPNMVFRSYGNRVDFSNSADVCRVGGGILSADQTPAAHQYITDQLRHVARPTDRAVYTYMGGDAMYSVNWQKDPTKRCQRGSGASLNCIYQWNLGAFADPSDDGLGVSFYRGSLYSLAGAGPMNGYNSYWPSRYPAHGQPFLLSRLDMSGEGATTTWYDSRGLATGNPDTLAESFGVVCEVQDGMDVNTTTLPPVVVVPWLKTHWYVVVLAVVLPLIAIFVPLIIICCCCCRGVDESKWVTPMVLREVNGEPLYAIGGTGDSDGFHEDDSRHLGGSTLMADELQGAMPMAVPSEGDVEVSMVIPHEGNVVYSDADVFN